MALNRRMPRQRTLVAVLAVVSLLVVTLDLRSEDGAVSALRRGVRDVFSPAESAIDAVVSPVGDAVSGVLDAGELRAENEELRRRLAEAEGALAQIQNVVRENEQLRELLDLEVAGTTDGVVASVTSLSPSNFQWTLQVDRGSDDGVATGMAVVIGGDGAQPVLVGRVSEVSSRRATVLLLQDPESRVSVRFARDGGLGTLVGSGDDESLTVEVLDAQATAGLRVGETVVTSGAEGSSFPGGIVVGRVTEVPAIGPADLTRDVVVEPLADLGRITRVKILTTLDDGGDGPAGTGSAPDGP